MRLVFAGTPDFAVPALDAIAASPHHLVACYTQPDRPAGRGRKLAESPVKVRARALALPIEQPFQGFLDTLAGTFEGREPDTTEENLQSRIRGALIDVALTMGRASPLLGR